MDKKTAIRNQGSQSLSSQGGAERRGVEILMAKHSLNSFEVREVLQA